MPKAKDPERRKGAKGASVRSGVLDEAAELRKGDKVTRGGGVVQRHARRPETTTGDTSDAARVRRDDPPEVR